MHRGANDEEINEFSNGLQINYPKSHKNSWTPHYGIAHDFGGGPENVISAWIPESALKHSFNQYNSPNLGAIKNMGYKKDDDFASRSVTEKDENEWIVEHNGPYHHANLKTGDIHTKISTRGKKDKLASSEKIQYNLNKQKWLKRHEEIEKGELANLGRGLVASLALAHGAHYIGDNPEQSKAPTSIERTIASPTKDNSHEVKTMEGSVSASSSYPHQEKNRILNSISQVESSGGKDTKHARLPSGGIHQGERAYGKYGLTPLLVKETIKMHPDLNKKYGYLTKWKGKLFSEGLDQAKGLEDEIASRHYDRLAEHFGHDVHKIGYGWLNGISGTHKAIKTGKDMKNHWHVKKIRKAYDKLGKK